MKIAAAPNAFRGSLSAIQAANAITDGLRRSALPSPEILSMPLADGGDGTLDVLLHGLGGERVYYTVTGPLGSPVQAAMGLLTGGDTSVIEIAQASGVELIPRPWRNPLIATTYGTGELIQIALERGCRRILIGIGGSATVDGAAGCVQALGARLLDAAGADIPPGGGGLSRLASIDVSRLNPLLKDAEITVLHDVTNPLLGPEGAARVFGPQKGATPAIVETLEANLTHFAEIIRRDLGMDVTTVPGGGSAGGLGAGLPAFLGARLAPGGPAIIDLLGYERQLPGVDLLITGEGKLDAQTSGGKAVKAIAKCALSAGIPVIALAGRLDANSAALHEMGICAAWSIIPEPCTLHDAIEHGAEWLARTATELGNTLAINLNRR